MPPSAVKAMADAVPTDLMQAIVREQRVPSTVRPSAASGPPVERGTGWAPENPIRPVGNTELVDRIVEKFVGPPNSVK
jgi:hypothetical protein